MADLAYLRSLAGATHKEDVKKIFIGLIDHLLDLEVTLAQRQQKKTAKIQTSKKKPAPKTKKKE